MLGRDALIEAEALRSYEIQARLESLAAIQAAIAMGVLALETVMLDGDARCCSARRTAQDCRKTAALVRQAADRLDMPALAAPLRAAAERLETAADRLEVRPPAS